ncbi:MAG TPA: hypothetical protein VMG12_36240 [Polyangiaceae bacterium]|nr:hypothetical protein [Polyangiaceae bacterium]
MRDSEPRRGEVRGARRRRWLRWALACLLAPGCVLDTDDRCGPYEVVYGDDERCVCVNGAAYTPTGCVPCGDFEVAGVTGCVCADGYARPTPEEPCSRQTQGDAGSACSVDAECTNPSYPHCERRASGAGYCTSQGCTTSEACAEGFDCITSASPSVCRLPPEGAGRACTAAADCAGSEALFCDTFQSHTCLVQDCSLDVDDCFPGLECCSVAPGVPNICIPSGACPT